MTVDFSEKKNVKKARDLEARRLARKENALKQLMSFKDGREWMHDLLITCHIFDTSFNTNALSMAHREGERNIGLQIFAGVMTSTPDEYLLMMKEAKEREDGRRNEYERDDDNDESSGA